MAEKNNAKCSICDNEYYMCISCKDALKVNPWKIHCDTPNCYKVYQVIHGYSTKVYTKDEARTKLKKIDLSNKDSFKPNIKSLIEDILKEPITNKSTTRKKSFKVEKVEEKIENQIVNTVEDVVVDNIDDVVETE